MHIVSGGAKKVAFALCLCFSSICGAIGFGDLKVYSYLSEPLVAEITLTNFKNMDPGLLKVGLADAKDFVRAGIDRPYFLTYLVFEILNYEDQLLIVVRTSKPVQAPYLEFLVELSWPEGNLIKDYTILLDPPPANLTKEKRPQALSQISEQARSNNFGVDAIQQQLDKQKADKQRAAAVEDLSNIVKLAPNSFSDNTFDVPEPTHDTQLVPGEVPDIDESAQEAAKKAQAEAEYQKQLAEFKQKEQAKAAAAAANKVIPDVVSKAADKLENVYDDYHNEEPIDFQHVITPIAPKIPEPTSVVTPPSPPSIPPAAYQPPIATKPVAGPSNHLYLGIILSLLLIAVGIAIAIKRMRNAKTHVLKESTEANKEFISKEFIEADIKPPAVKEIISEELDEPEEIELTSTVPVDIPVVREDSVSKFERDFENIDLSELATPVVTEPVAVESVAVESVALAPEDTITIEPPTMVKQFSFALEPEDTALSQPLTNNLYNSEAVQLKLDLAKQYLETGDKDSAKELLQEIIEIANDAQRLEAQIILSGIV